VHVQQYRFEDIPSIVMQALKELGQGFVLLCVLLKLVQHLDMLFENVLVCFGSEGDVNPFTDCKLVNAALDL
jgi:hypothetical protein